MTFDAFILAEYSFISLPCLRDFRLSQGFCKEEWKNK